MFRQWFCFFLVAHALGDFYFQTERMAARKAQRWTHVALHGAVYLAVFAVCALPFFSAPLAIAAAALAVAHFAADSGKYLLTRRPRGDAAVFAADQLVHIGCIAVASAVLAGIGAPLKLLTPAEGFLASLTPQPMMALAWAGLVLLAVKPANVTIKRLTAKYRPADDAADVAKAGGFIGALERLLILLLMSVGQYAAIGLVLTAKSVARYNRIAESKQFAEYYLLGTLLSALFAVGAYLLMAQA